MFRKRINPRILKVFIVLVCFAFTTAWFSANANAARVIPAGKVSIIKDGRVIGEFSQEASLPEGYLLKCEGKCAVKLDDVYMAVERDTVFSVKPTATSHMVYVQEGTVYYSISESSRPLQISSPAGDIATGDLSLSDSELRGYVRVAGNKTEIGVLSGGSMKLETESGEMIIASGKKVTMTFTDPGTSVAAAGGQKGSGPKTTFVIGAVGAGVLAAGGIALALGGNSSDGGDGSPSSP